MRHGLIFLLCLLAMTALALAMARHQEAQWDHPLPAPASLGLRVAGWVGLTLAMWLAVAAWGWTLGLVAWIGHSSLAAGLVYGALLWRQQWRLGAARPGAGTLVPQPSPPRHPG